MKRFIAFALFIAFVTATGAAAPALAQNDRAAAPSADTFEDGDCRLKLFGVPGETGMRVTLVYENAETRTIESITVDPELVTSVESDRLDAFLAKIDSGFLSFVRATLADRLLHLRAEPKPLDVAESSLFFRRKIVWDGARMSE